MIDYPFEYYLYNDSTVLQRYSVKINEIASYKFSTIEMFDTITKKNFILNNKFYNAFSMPSKYVF